MAESGIDAMRKRLTSKPRPVGWAARRQHFSAAKRRFKGLFRSRISPDSAK
ncbi:hypothetical protein ABTF10_18800 [Acinetobacter baumannii]|nr:hypothetical protein [Bradyrhizobium sp.]